MHAAVARECRAVRDGRRHLRCLDARQDRGRRPGRGRVPEPHLHQCLDEARARPLPLRPDAEGGRLHHGRRRRRAPRARPLPRHDHDRRRGARAQPHGGLPPDRVAGPEGLPHLDHRAVRRDRRCRARRRARCSRRSSPDIDLVGRGLPAHGGARRASSAACRAGCSASPSRASSASRSTCRPITARRSGRRSSSAARRFGITPYGTETMHVLRAEKGFIIVGQETDGTVTPDDVGLGGPDRQGQAAISSASARSRGPTSSRAGRKQLVGLLTDDPRRGAGRGRADRRRSGTSRSRCACSATSRRATGAPACGRSIALALVAGGRVAHGRARSMSRRRTASPRRGCASRSSSIAQGERVHA